MKKTIGRRQAEQDLTLTLAKIIKCYDGTVPTNGDTALSGNTLLATITAITFGATNSSGVATVTSSTNELNAPAGGTPTFIRLFAVDGSTCLGQCSVVSGEVTFSPTTIALGGIVAGTSISITLSVGT